MIAGIVVPSGARCSSSTARRASTHAGSWWEPAAATSSARASLALAVPVDAVVPKRRVCVGDGDEDGQQRAVAAPNLPGGGSGARPAHWKVGDELREGGAHEGGALPGEDALAVAVREQDGAVPGDDERAVDDVLEDVRDDGARRAHPNFIDANRPIRTPFEGTDECRSERQSPRESACSRPARAFAPSSRIVPANNGSTSLSSPLKRRSAS